MNIMAFIINPSATRSLSLSKRGRLKNNDYNINKGDASLFLRGKGNVTILISPITDLHG